MKWEAEQDQQMLAYYQGLIAMRKKFPFICQEEFNLVICDDHVLAYQRGPEAEGLLVVCNLSDQEQHVNVHGDWKHIEMLTSRETHVQTKIGGVKITLGPISGVVISKG
jgi:glycosidase